MSQASSLTGGLALLPAEETTVAPLELVEGDRRAQDPLSRLSRRMDGVCTGAVDALEIAAALEADGLTDALARLRFGLPDVFAVAEELHARVPLRSHARPAVDGEAVSRRCIARGALFALPGVYFFGLEHSISSRLATLVLVGVTIGGWAVSQAISILAHGVLARRGRPAALGLLRWTLIGSLLAAAGVAAVGRAAFDWPAGLTAVAIGLGVYVVAATALVFVEADLWLGAMMVPGAAAAAAHSLGGSAWIPWDAVLGVMTAGIALVVLAALWQTRGAMRAGAMPTRREARRAGPYVVYGLLAGSLVAAPIVGPIIATQRGAATLLAAGMVPLTLSMGFAEFELRRHVARTRRALGRELDLRVFGRVAGRSLAVASIRYLAAVVLLGAVSLAVVALSGHSPADPLVLMTGYTLLGCALFLGLVTTAAGKVWAVALSFSLALAIFAAAVGLGGTSADAAFIVAASGLVVAVGLDAFRDVRNVVNHR
ncbi:MAG TPA: hypothetical protein VKD47_01620 [Miltoncostaeaceae bacterium]|nr:hypothetical protein [Miltoncostaeaceae bacterium]